MVNKLIGRFFDKNAATMLDQAAGYAGGHDFSKYAFTLSRLGVRNTLKLLLNRLCSVNHYYVMYKRLDSPLREEKIKKRVSLGLINNDDLEVIIKSIESLDSDSRRELISRLLFYKSGFINCYAAKTKTNEIEYIQWLIYPDENHVIEKHYSRIFSPLGKEQVMLENAFTFPKFRGIGLLPNVTSMLLNIAKEAGYKSAVTYIRKDRIAALNEFMKMGFKITKLIPEYKFIGITKRLL